MLTRNYGATFGTVKMLLGALIFLGGCASICSASHESESLAQDVVQNENLKWINKNPKNPKFAQMLNMLNLKTEKKRSLYAVQSVRQAKDQDGASHFEMVFWPITDELGLPSCRVKFFIPLFGRHRDMTVESYDCDPGTLNKETITEITHLNFNGDNNLLTLQPGDD